MAIYFWVGGAGTWDSTTTTNWSLTSGGAGDAGVPVLADTANFDSLSGTGAVGIAALATCTTCNFGAAGINAAYTANHTGAITNFFMTAGAFSTEAFNSTTTGSIRVNGGVFTANGGTITLSQFSAAPTVSCTINLNASVLNLTVAGSSLHFSGTGLIFNAGTSTINCSAQTAQSFLGNGVSFYNVAFTGSVCPSIIIFGANTFNNLTFSPKGAGMLCAVSIGANQIVNGTLSLALGGTPSIYGSARVCFQSNTIGTARTITAATVLLNDADFRDIIGAGTATWSGTRLGDCGGNTNITFDAAKTVYWNKAGSNNIAGTTQGWATTQTGVPTAINFPLPQDTAVFTDTAPVAGSILTIGSAFNLGTLDFSTRSNTLTLANGTSAPSIYGDITLSSAITITGSGVITLAGRNKTQTIICSGRTFTQQLTQSTIGGSVTFADSFATTNLYAVNAGAFSTNFNVTCAAFSSNSGNTRSVTLGAMVLSLTAVGACWDLRTPALLTFNAGASRIIFTDNSTATTRLFYGGGLTYNDLEIGGTGVLTTQITDSNTFNTISSTKTVAHTVQFAASATTRVANWTVTGTAGNVVTVKSSTAVFFNLAKTGGGTISTDYMNITNSHATPAATWFATNTIDGGGNTGWVITSPPKPAFFSMF